MCAINACAFSAKASADSGVFLQCGDAPSVTSGSVFSRALRARNRGQIVIEPLATFGHVGRQMRVDVQGSGSCCIASKVAAGIR